MYPTDHTCSVPVLPDESFTDLCIRRDRYGYATASPVPHTWQVLQKTRGFRFSIDAVLLSHFIEPASNKAQRLLDLGTGSGIMPLLLAARYEQLQIDGIELQPDIADMATRSVQYNHMEQHIKIHQYDLTQLPSTFDQQYDFVISNPPFFPVGSGKQNPDMQIALARHEIACTLEQLIQCAYRTLNDRGHFAVIHRAERLTELLSLCQNYRLTPYRLRMVHPTLDQPANLILMEAIKNGRNGIHIMPPLAIYETTAAITSDKSTYSKEVLSYYQ